MSMDAAGLGNRRSSVPVVCWTQLLSEPSMDRLQISKSKRSALGVAIDLHCYRGLGQHQGAAD